MMAVTRLRHCGDDGTLMSILFIILVGVPLLVFSSALWATLVGISRVTRVCDVAVDARTEWPRVSVVVPACEHGKPALQSPADFDANPPEVAESCDPVDTNWRKCHQHFHCEPEHSGAGLCAPVDGAGCEVHTVYRKPTAGGVADEITDLHEGTLGDKCEPDSHHLFVRATFISFHPDCGVGEESAVTYCGSSTGKNTSDTSPTDGYVECAEAAASDVSVRWCLETACDCRSGVTEEGLKLEFGEEE